MIAFIDPLLAVIALVALAGLLSIDIRGSWRTFEQYQEVQEERGLVARVAHESFDGALTVKALGREDTETARFERSSDNLRRMLTSVGVTFSTYRVVVEGLLSVVTVVMLVAGAIRIEAAAVTPGEVITIAYLLSLLFIPIRIIGFMLWDMSHSTAAWRRIQRVLTADELVEYGTLETRLWPSGAEVDGASIGFGYLPDQPVLLDVHLDIRSGKVVAVVGPTGSGKSTLVTLLARLWDPGSGSITIDGADLPRVRPVRPARRGRLRRPGRLPLRRHGAGQHRLRHRRRRRCGADGRRRCRRHRVHRAAPPAVGHPGR